MNYESCESCELYNCELYELYEDGFMNYTYLLTIDFAHFRVPL